MRELYADFSNGILNVDPVPHLQSVGIVVSGFIMQVQLLSVSVCKSPLATIYPQLQLIDPFAEVSCCLRK
jgi:hypothetical protein